MISMHVAVQRFRANIHAGDRKKIIHSIEYLEERQIENYWDKSVLQQIKEWKARLMIK